MRPLPLRLPFWKEVEQSLAFEHHRRQGHRQEPGIRSRANGSGERMAMEDIGKRVVRNRMFYIASIFTLSLMLAASAAFVGGCDEKEVSLQYDPQPGLAIVTVENDGGLPFPGDDLLPVFQLFGDGRFIKYQEQSSNRGIFVLGKLDEAAIADLLQKIADTGFFDLKDEYVDPDVYDATYRRIAVGLAETEKKVTVWMFNDVPEFDTAYGLILDYPTGEVSEYVPDKGYLVVVSYPNLGNEAYDFLDPNGDIYKLLPDTETLKRATADHVAVAVDGATFMQLKKYDNEQKSRGLYISQPDSTLVVYPVYEPRTADKP